MNDNNEIDDLLDDIPAWRYASVLHAWFVRSANEFHSANKSIFERYTNELRAVGSLLQAYKTLMDLEKASKGQEEKENGKEGEKRNVKDCECDGKIASASVSTSASAFARARAQVDAARDNMQGFFRTEQERMTLSNFWSPAQNKKDPLHLPLRFHSLADACEKVAAALSEFEDAYAAVQEATKEQLEALESDTSRQALAEIEAYSYTPMGGSSFDTKSAAEIVDKYMVKNAFDIVFTKPLASFCQIRSTLRASEIDDKAAVASARAFELLENVTYSIADAREQWYSARYSFRSDGTYEIARPERLCGCLYVLEDARLACSAIDAIDCGGF